MKLLIAIGAVVLGLAVVPTALASHPGPPSFNPVERWLQTCNDQESIPGVTCITDPMGCTWGDEDDVADSAYGKLSAGQSISDTLCLVTDPCSDFACPHQILYQVYGAGLQITLSDDRGDTWTATSASLKNPTSLCFNDPLWTGDQVIADYPTLPGTGGGYGFLTSYTLTVTATKTTQMSAGFEIAQNDADGRFGYYHSLSTVACPLR